MGERIYKVDRVDNSRMVLDREPVKLVTRYLSYRLENPEGEHIAEIKCLVIKSPLKIIYVRDISVPISIRERYFRKGKGPGIGKAITDYLKAISKKSGYIIYLKDGTMMYENHEKVLANVYEKSYGFKSVPNFPERKYYYPYEFNHHDKLKFQRIMAII